MAANSNTIQIEIQIDDKGGVKVLRQIGHEAEKSGKKGEKGFREMDRAASGFNTRIKSMHSLLLKLGVGYAIVRTAREIWELTGFASDLNETISKSRAIFGASSAGIEAWAARSATAIGMSTQVALEHTATLGNMYQQLGAGVDIAKQSSMAMVKLAADLVSFHNVAGGASEVLLAMQSSFRGEYDALQRYIPTINAAAVQEQALAMTHKATAKELTNLEKALAAQAIIMRDAGAAVGDFDRTSRELANQERILAAQIENVKAKLGRGFLPIATQTINHINDWIEANETLLSQNIPLYIEGIVSALKLGLAPLKAWADLWKTLGWVSGGGKGIMPGFEDTIAEQIQALEEKRANIVKNYTGSYKDEYIANVDASIAALKEKARELEKINQKTGSTEPGPKPPPDLTSTKTTTGMDQTKEDLKKLTDLERELAAAQEEFERAKVLASGTYEIMEQQFRRGIADNIKAITIEAEDSYSVLRNLSQRTAEAMEQNFSDFYFDVMRGEFDDLGDYADAMLMSIQRATADVMGQMTKEALFGKGAGGSGLISGLGTWIGGLFDSGSSYAGAGTYGVNPGDINWHAKGGSFGPDEWIGVGEDGPEIIYTGSKSGQVIPSGAGRGDVSIQVNVINESGEPLQAEQGQVRFDGQQYIADVHIDKMINSRGYRQANRQAMR